MASPSAYHLQPHIHQDFDLSAHPHSDTGDTTPPDTLFGGSMGGFHPDINDELASLMNQSHERSRQSPGAFEAGPGGGDTGFRPHTHNIFDISAPTSAHHGHGHHHVGSASSTSSFFSSLPNGTTNGAGNGGGSGGSNGSGSPSQQSLDVPPYHFNSTLPALNSSMRYDPPYNPPSAFRSPSPHQHHAHTQPSRSRSRSRPPSSHLSSTPAGGPTRTGRTRRAGSMTSTSPPPRPVPQAIVIPGACTAQTDATRSKTGASGACFLLPSPHLDLDTTDTPPAATTPHPLPTPDSLPSLTSLPSLASLGSLGSQHLASPHSHTLNSPVHAHLHSPGSPHPFHGHGHGHGQHPYGYGSPVEAKFGGMALSGGMPGSLPASVGVTAGPGTGTGTGAQTNGADAGPGPGAGTTKQNATDKAAALANEKRRRRRESHNAVERRRRDNINEKISELATLIPECMLEEAPTNGTGTGKKDAGADEDSKDGVKDGGGVVKANKGMILRKSVEYIRYLQQLVTAQGARNRELEEQLTGFGVRPVGAGSQSGSELGGGLLNGSALAGFGGLGMGMWGLASMPEGDGDGDEGLDADVGLGGMDVEMVSGAGADAEPKPRGRKTTRAGGGGDAKKASAPAPALTNGTRKKLKKEVALEDEQLGLGGGDSDMSDGDGDGMDV
ncbi:BHLH domain-containing protein [Mycena kentingensis (nom. inval.)]|nr:BHLH domain-containing protein [Mycena kentingensis (nom. inval.)]